jgi:RNA binding exosome subunit
VSAFVHATEDEARVKAAIFKILPPEIAEKSEFSCTGMNGHHGNPILELKSSITKREEANKILLKILRELSPLDENLLDGELPNHLDARNWFYLRLDKQQAFLGYVSVGYHDIISFAFCLNSKPESLRELKNILETVVGNGESV